MSTSMSYVSDTFTCVKLAALRRTARYQALHLRSSHWPHVNWDSMMLTPCPTDDKAVRAQRGRTTYPRSHRMAEPAWSQSPRLLVTTWMAEGRGLLHLPLTPQVARDGGRWEPWPSLPGRGRP